MKYLVLIGGYEATPLLGFMLLNNSRVTCMHLNMKNSLPFEIQKANVKFLSRAVVNYSH